MKVHLLSIGTAVPPGKLSQTRAIELSRTLSPRGIPEGAIELLHRRCGIDSRAFAIVDPATGNQTLYETDALGRGPTTAARLAVYTREATRLGIEAATNALTRAGVTADSVTHLVTVSCTGFEAPGIDQKLAIGVGLWPTVSRTHIGFMGCHGAINALAVARSIAAADARAVVLVCCVELCSLHMHYTERTDQLIANALFADGAAAAVVSQKGPDGLPEVRACASCLLPDSADAMSWRIGDHGFEMSLSVEVPERLTREIPTWIDSVLDSCGLRRADVRGWAIHPGGPKIIEGVARALSLPSGSTDDSLATLREHGNMSSPTVLFILDRFVQAQRPRAWVAMAFGPGLAAEAVVVV
ncbi:MAG: type III polyketide synthase [Phycisphaerales bacterium]